MKKNLLKKNSILALISLLFVSQTVFSQSIEELYVKMPDILNPTLTRQNRLELLEYHKAHQSDSTVNRFGNHAHLLTMDTLNMRITVQNTATSTFDMKIGFMNDSIPYISLIRTACAPVCHSTIEFYDTAWNAIPIRFTMPKAIEWLDIKNIKSDSIDLDWIKNSLAVSFISLSFSDEDNVIVAKNNTLDFINEEDRKVIKPFLSEKILVYSLLDKTWTRRP